MNKGLFKITKSIRAAIDNIQEFKRLNGDESDEYFEKLTSIFKNNSLAIVALIDTTKTYENTAIKNSEMIREILADTAILDSLITSKSKEVFKTMLNDVELLNRVAMNANNENIVYAGKIAKLAEVHYRTVMDFTPSVELKDILKGFDSTLLDSINLMDIFKDRMAKNATKTIEDFYAILGIENTIAILSKYSDTSEEDNLLLAKDYVKKTGMILARYLFPLSILNNSFPNVNASINKYIDLLISNKMGITKVDDSDTPEFTETSYQDSVNILPGISINESGLVYEPDIDSLDLADVVTLLAKMFTLVSSIFILRKQEDISRFNILKDNLFKVVNELYASEDGEWLDSFLTLIESDTAKNKKIDMEVSKYLRSDSDLGSFKDFQEILDKVAIFTSMILINKG